MMLTPCKCMKVGLWFQGDFDSFYTTWTWNQMKSSRLWRMTLLGVNLYQPLPPFHPRMTNDDDYYSYLGQIVAVLRADILQYNVRELLRHVAEVFVRHVALIKFKQRLHLFLGEIHLRVQLVHHTICEMWRWNKNRDDFKIEFHWRVSITHETPWYTKILLTKFLVATLFCDLLMRDLISRFQNIYEFKWCSVIHFDGIQYCKSKALAKFHCIKQRITNIGIHYRD